VDEAAAPASTEEGLNIILEETEISEQSSRNQTRSITQCDEDLEEEGEEEEEEPEETQNEEQEETQEEDDENELDEQEEDEEGEQEEDEEDEEEELEEESQVIEQTIGELNTANSTSPEDQSPSVIQNETHGVVNATYVVNPVVRRKSVQFDMAIENPPEKEESDFRYEKTPYRPQATSKLTKRNSYQDRDERPILSKHISLDDSNEYTPPSVQFKSILRKSNTFNAKGKNNFELYLICLFKLLCRTFIHSLKSTK
jgi:hypothetical protein